jgi:hypothetical protein
MSNKKFKDLKEAMLNVCNAIDHCLNDEEVYVKMKLKLLLQRIDLNIYVKNYNHAKEDLNLAMKHMAPNSEDGNKVKDEFKLSPKEIGQFSAQIFEKFFACAFHQKNYQQADKFLSYMKNNMRGMLHQKHITPEEHDKFLNEYYNKVSQEVIHERESLKKDLESQEAFKMMEIDEKEATFNLLTDRGVVVKNQVHKIPMHSEAQIYLDTDDNFHFPLLIIYEEFNMSDYIQDFNGNSTMQEIIDLLFSEKMPWDKEKLYTKFSLKLFMEMNIKDDGYANYVTTYYYPLLNTDRLFDILKRKKIVMNGFPVISICSTNSKFFDHFMSKKIILNKKIK